MRQSLKGLKGGFHWETLVPYSFEECLQHITPLFESGMCLQNFGRGEGKWNIDQQKKAVNDMPLSEESKASITGKLIQRKNILLVGGA